MSCDYKFRHLFPKLTLSNEGARDVETKMSGVLDYRHSMGLHFQGVG